MFSLPKFGYMMGSDHELCCLIDIDSSPGSAIYLLTFDKLLNLSLNFLIRKIAFVYYCEQIEQSINIALIIIIQYMLIGKLNLGKISGASLYLEKYFFFHITKKAIVIIFRDKICNCV